jgi:nucleotide-binding universal stress UspA family protein
MSPAPRVVESHGEALERVRLEAIEALEMLAHEQLTGINVTWEVDFNAHPAEAISEKAEALGADIIVMATHGRSGLSHMLAGSVTEAVIRNSGRPVLVNCPK